MDATRKHKRKIRKKVLAVWALRALVAILLMGICAVVILMYTLKPSEEDLAAQVMYGVIADGVTVNGTDVSGLTYSQAYSRLIGDINDDVASISISVRCENSLWLLTGADMSVHSDIDDVLKEALLLGFDGTVMGNRAARKEILSAGYALNTTLTADETVLADKIEIVADALDSPPVDPYAVPNSKSALPEFTYYEGESGYVLNTGALIEAVNAAIANEEFITVIEPVLEYTEPEITMEWVRENTSLRSTFSTSFGASSSTRNANRMRNIQKASDILNGATVPDGGEWSFNTYIGPRYESDGWALAPSIINGSTYVQEAGGGICQVSTTLYNTLLRCGTEIEITERHNHSWPSSYVDYGLDATVSTGGPDFKFVNNTGGPIYIFAYTDTTNYTITVYIFGIPLPDGVTYVTRGEIDQVLKPGDPVTTEDPTLPVGTQVVDVKAREGYVTTAYLDRLQDGVVVETIKLYSDKYRAVQGQIRVGTKE